MREKIFFITKYLPCFVSVLILISLGCAPKETVVQDDVKFEYKLIPPVEISEYILGFGDELDISIYRHDDMNRKVRILPDGKIQYPLIGEINAQGLSVNQLRDKLREGLLKYFVDPQISVAVTSIGSQKFFVLGEVKKPGVFQLDRPKTAVDAISEAGVFTLDAKHAFYIFLLRQAFMQIPPDLEDAARMDGASTLQVLWNVILPLSRPALATVAIFTFQAAWNDFLAPLIFLHDQSLYTLQFGLSLFRGAYNVQWAYLMAASLVVTMPVIFIFFFAQRSFIEGIGLMGTKF